MRLRSSDPWGWVALIVPLAAYVGAARLGVDFWDAGEMQTVPYILGIAHPTGFPAFTLLGWLFAHVFAVGSVAWRINVFCALAMALAARLLYGTARELGVEPPTAAGAALVFAFGDIAWTHASRADVHALATAFAAVLLRLAVRWWERPEPRLLPWIGLAAGVALANHPVAVLLFPGLVWILAARRAAAGLRAVVAAAVLFAVGLGLYAYLPARSAIVSAQHVDPTLALGLPPGRPFWDDDHPSTWAGFRLLVTGSEFGTGATLLAIADPRTYAELPTYLGRWFDQFGLGGTALALLGAIVWARRRPALAGGLILAGFLPVAFALGFSAESDVERYFLPSLWVSALFVGLGTSRLTSMIDARHPLARRFLGGAVLALVAGSLAYANRGTLDQRGDDAAGRFVAEVRARTPRNAIIVATWNYATPLAYAAYVEHALGARTLVTAWPADYESFYPDWLLVLRRPVFVVSSDPIDLRGFVTRAVPHASENFVEILR